MMIYLNVLLSLELLAKEAFIEQTHSTTKDFHILGSHVELIFIVSSYQAPKIKWGLIDRYLVLAEQEGIKPIIIINKVDLLNSNMNQKEKEECLENEKYFKKLGYELITLQANSVKKYPTHFKKIKKNFAKIKSLFFQATLELVSPL